MTNIMLELFSGTGSVGDVAREMGWQVMSLDRDMPAYLWMDVMDWDFKVLPPSMFDFIWASPPAQSTRELKAWG